MTGEEFSVHLRRALNHLYEPDRLRQNPLAVLLGVANRLDTFSVLQNILIETIESLEPDADELPQSPMWEIYEPLYYRYVQQLTQSQVAKQLGMSVRHLRRKEHAALEVLAAHLWERFDLGAKLREGATEWAASTRPAERGSTVSEELAWLKDAPPDTPIDLKQTLSDALALARPLAAQRGIHLEMEIADALPDLLVHELALSQTLLNVIAVAIHRASAQRILISAKPLPLEVEIRILGTKSLSDHHSLTEDDAVVLDVAQELVDLCGGKLAISDDDEAFKAALTLPVLEQLPVLAIDDNADTLQLLQRYAAGTRYRIITTQDPEQVLGLAAKFSPKIVVLDVMMPRVDGWKVLAQLRQNPLTEQIPIVVCTIMPQEEMAMAMGASGFVRKPVTRQAFLTALDRQVEQIESLPGPESH